jgi:hypothetical protein
MALLPNAPNEQLFAALRRVRASWPARGWSWDSRMVCVTSSFSTEFETKARAAIAEALTVEWTSSSIGRAPPLLRDYVDRYGGLRHGQVLFSSGNTAGSLSAFGLWWPWGDGGTISMRIGFPDVDPARDAYVRVRDIFGVQL